ncbi:hypothetical protein ASAP_1179 [Asaia bogorensis]|uniref:Uncharacterized protein n=1 Tax=Asaia bogorensis TaxID=91915 RepID=A0A060QDQ3_9PROT|nr:hypothetical protein ASAP_1179 [Asaia bogorensis]
MKSGGAISWRREGNIRLIPIIRVIVFRERVKLVALGAVD